MWLRSVWALGLGKSGRSKYQRSKHKSSSVQDSEHEHVLTGLPHKYPSGVFLWALMFKSFASSKIGPETPEMKALCSKPCHICISVLPPGSPDKHKSDRVAPMNESGTATGKKPKSIEARFPNDHFWNAASSSFLTASVASAGKVSFGNWNLRNAILPYQSAGSWNGRLGYKPMSAVNLSTRQDLSRNVHIDIHLSIHVHVHIHIHVHVHVHINIHIYIRIHATFLYRCTYTYAYTHTYTYRYPYTYAHTYTCTYTSAYAYAYANTYTYTCKHTRTRRHVHSIYTDIGMYFPCLAARKSRNLGKKRRRDKTHTHTQ